MFGIHRKLRHWQDHGLITADQAAAIGAYEQDRHKGRFLRSMIGLALFAIGIGVLLVVAANWAAIPAIVKLGVHFTLNAGLAYGIYKTLSRPHEAAPLAREGLLLGLAALTLTLMALIGQVFQLSGSVEGLLTLWLILVLPLLFVHGRTGITALPGVLGLTALPFLLRIFLKPADATDLTDAVSLLALCLFVPLGLLAVSTLPWLRRERPDWSHQTMRTGGLLTGLMGVTGTFLWYEDIGRDLVRMVEESNLSYNAVYLALAVVPALALCGIVLFAYQAIRHATDPRAARLGCQFAFVCVLFAGAPFFIPTASLDLVAAISFILLFGYMAWFARESGATRLMSLAVLMIAIRIYVIYLEVFGSMLQSGVGLIFAGLCLLALLWGFKRINDVLTGHRAARTGAAS